MRFLTIPRSSFKKVDKGLLNYASGLIEKNRDTYRELPVRKTNNNELNSPLHDIIPKKMPLEGIADSKDVLDILTHDVLETNAQINHPGFIAHMDPPTPSIAIAAGMMQIATNQNLLHPDVAPKARQIEQRVVDWLASYFHMDGGHFVPGSTIANLTALWAARETRDITTIIASNKSHLSVKKAANLLNLNYIECETNEKDEMIINELLNVKDLNQSAVVLTAGTVACGAFDPIDEYFDKVGKMNGSGTAAKWVHIDSAWAGPLQLSSKYNHIFNGIEYADSFGFSAHKWMYQPKGTALCLFKNVDEAHEALSYGGGYLSAPNIGLLGTAPASAIPLCATLLKYGLNGMVDLIENDMNKANELIELIQANDNKFELFNSNVCGVVVWRAKNKCAGTIRDSLKNGWVSLCEINGEFWFRSVFSNPNADPKLLFDEVSKVC